MENVNRWYFTKDQLANTPSKKCDIDYARELSYRQQAANFIQDMGQRLQLSQLCINTAIVYMHRFYVFHSFTEVHRNNLSISALFLAAKVEEQPRKLEHVIKVAHVCLHKDAPPALDVRSEAYAEKAQEVVAHENILLQTLGFVLAIEHPHTYVVKVCQLVKASKDLAQSSYLMATTSLHMTTMCIQYKPTVVACVCIHLACKWSSYLIEPCSEGREWFYYVDRTVTLELLEKLTQEFIAILETSPHRFKKKYGKESGGYHDPKTIIENAAKEAKEASASAEKRNGISVKKEPSPGPSTSLSYDFCPDFDDKPLKFDNGPSTNSRRPPEMQIVKKPPTSKKAPPHEPPPEPQKKPEPPVQKAPVVYVKQEPELEARIEPEVDLKPAWPLPLATLSSEKRNGLSPIVDPPMDAFDFNYTPKVEINYAPKVESNYAPKLESNYAPKVDTSYAPKVDTNYAPKVENSYAPKVDTNYAPKVENSYAPKVETTKPVAVVHALEHGASSGHTSSRKSSGSHSSKHERRERHKSKHSSHSSSKDRHNHQEQPLQPQAGIKIKIPKDIISIKGGKEPSQKTATPPLPPLPPLPKQEESPMRSLKIKIGNQPPPTQPTPLKLVLTKDKSGSGSYSTSHKNERDSRKRSHSNSVPTEYKNSHEPPPPKSQKVNHSSTKSHYKTDGYNKRHGSHHNDVHGQNDKTTFQPPTSYSHPLQPPPFFPADYANPSYPVMHVVNSKLNPIPIQPPLPPPQVKPPLPPE